MGKFFVSVLVLVACFGCGGETGVLQVESDPKEVQVFVDGDKVGDSTPISLKLEEGDHTIKLDNPGYDIKEFNIFVGPKSIQKKSVTLNKLVFPRKEAVGRFSIIKETPMVSIPAGRFEMGSSSDGESDEKPVHTVDLDAYKMEKYEATAWQYARFLNEKGNPDKKYMDEVAQSTVVKAGSSYQARSGYENHPVNNVSWYGADAYCRWKGKRLPTEAEWEKAARGTDGRKYPWGNDDPSPKRAVYNGSIDKLNAVDSHPDGVSPYGLHHMAGNLWEWTADWYDSGYYGRSPSSNPKGPSSGSMRVLRGGSWGSDARSMRAAYRNYSKPDDRYYYRGFRCSQ